MVASSAQLLFNQEYCFGSLIVTRILMQENEKKREKKERMKKEVDEL